ncbi:MULTISPECIES: tetratricopeptide repeat protein [Parafrankia]|uniref:tetratricopeptide repeat protein n=1 Tax=Parafrankia TaxID=2994362 RepID=UPI000A52049F|nr:MULTISPECIES: tetratricopeptide repeat protein [Parafrankia]MBE3205727.1 tetratricopeptide repeat protein [Parafrankia sp. CH37]
MTCRCWSTARYSALGHHQAARELDEDTLTRQRRILGPDHSHTLTTTRLISWIDEQSSRG